jgi:2-polyprenyl-6-methoxyphenol hydroxylase-like FAD-dependent oxidoreductase
MDNSIYRVVVVGGGIGGLCTAIALRQIGVEVTVYEQAPAWGEVGAGLSLWANALRALRKLGLAEAVIAAGVKVEEGALLTWRGKALTHTRTGEFEALSGEPTIVIHRAKLRQILLDMLPAEWIRLGETCVGFRQDETGVTVRFASGRMDRADLLIGVDGIHSVVRQKLFPDVKPRYSGYTAWRGVVATEIARALGRTSESWGAGARFGIVPVSSREVYWYATANTPAGQRLTAKENKHALRRRFRGWHDPVEKLIEITPSKSILHNDIYDIEPMSQWSRGRVVLVGDAAHPTTPNLGQGACQAIESSLALASSLAHEPDLDAAFRRYEIGRMERTARITNQSWQIGRIGQLENRLACALRNFAISLAPSNLTKRHLAEVIGIQ